MFKELSITVKPGEVIGISGPSGCGKSTLAKLMAGYERPVGGAVAMGGQLPVRNGFNPVQLIGQHPEKAVNPRWRMRRTLNEGFCPDEGLTKALGIEKPWLERWPNELSGGELQRFCIARALGPDTRHVIADEISTMLDPVTQAQIWTVLISIVQERRIGLLAISHDQALLEKICGQVYSWDALAGREALKI